jgi:hypothetical protein
MTQIELSSGTIDYTDTGAWPLCCQRRAWSR